MITGWSFETFTEAALPEWTGTYKLQIRSKRPQFQVVAIHPDDNVPGALTVPQGGTGALQLLAIPTRWF